VQLYALPIDVDGQQVGTVVTSASMQPYERGLQLALFGSIGVALAVLAGVYAGARVVVARALRPVGEMTRQAARWSADDVNNRFATTSRYAELDALAGTLDGMLDRISAVLRLEKLLSGELSHELRTPLTHILAEVELLAGSTTHPETVATYARVARSAERMQTILTTLLQAARAESGTAPGRCDVTTAVRACLEDWPAGEPVVALAGSEGIAAGAPTEIVERIIQPLLDNARRYARARVDVTVSPSPRGPVVVIADDGPGIPPDWLETAFEAGFSTDEAHGGAGLGLALARRLARAAGGDVIAEASATGARLVVSLPGG
jgi:signal transduction histidine kinase